MLVIAPRRRPGRSPSHVLAALALLAGVLAAVLAGALAVALPAAAAAAEAPAARVLRIASAQDPQTMDPHALALLYHTRVVTQIYEGLVGRDARFALEPALAMSWSAVNPTTWRFRLRPGVRFHDGTAFTAEDAAFSIQRAMARTSERRTQLRGITGTRVVDPLTLDILLEAPDAVLPEKLWLIGMMSRAWCVANGVEQAQDYNARQETYAVRRANGTGPFMLERYEADKQVVLTAHAGWWGRAPGAPPGSAPAGNVDQAVYLVIQSDATRMAALASRQADIVVDPPFQDIARLRAGGKVKLTDTTDIGTQYLTFDVRSDALPGSDARGNPLRDARVRRAIEAAIDVDLIVQKVLRGQGRPTGSFVSPLVDGHVPALEPRAKADPAAARALLKEAGWADGFTLPFDCVNITFREAVCQAVAAMLEKVGIRARLQTHPASTFFPRLMEAKVSLAEFGWSPGTDPWASFNSLLHTHDGRGAGAFNAGRWSNPKADALIDAIRTEPDLPRRRERIGELLRLVAEERPMVPLYRRALAWAMRPDLQVVHLPSDVLDLRWVRLP